MAELDLTMKTDDEIVDEAIRRADYIAMCGPWPETSDSVPPGIVAWRAERARIAQEYEDWLTQWHESRGDDDE